MHNATGLSIKDCLLLERHALLDNMRSINSYNNYNNDDINNNNDNNYDILLLA